MIQGRDQLSVLYRIFNLFEEAYLLSREKVEKTIKDRIISESINLHDSGSIFYLMLLCKDFSIGDKNTITSLIEKQKDLINNESLDGTLNATLTSMMQFTDNANETKINDLLSEEYTFLESLYYISHFSCDLGELSTEIKERIDGRTVEYGYSVDFGSDKLDLEATYRITYARYSFNIL